MGGGDNRGVGVPEPTDRDLLVAVADGDATALRALYERHAPWLSVRLQRRCQDPEVVAEVLQDTFLAVWRGARKYRGDSEVAGWLWGIGVRRLVSALRGRPGAVEVPVAEVDDADLGAVAAAEDLVLLGVEHGDAGAALASLSPEFRAVIQATVLDGLTTREAARLLGVPEGTVKTRAMRARAQLRAALAGGQA